MTLSCDTELLGCLSPHCALQGAARQHCPGLEGAGVTRKDWGLPLPGLQVSLAGRGTVQEGTGRCGSCSLPAAFSKSSQSAASSILRWEHTFPMADVWLLWQQALPQSCCRGSGSGSGGCLLTALPCAVCAHAVLAAPAEPTHTLCKGTGVHAASTSLLPVLGGCRQVQSPGMEGTKAQRAPCGWSPVTTLSCLLVLPGPTRTASWRIWTRLG